MIFSSKNPEEKSKPKPPQDVVERRQHKRIKKNFILTYYDLAAPEERFEVTQLRNISMGGLCFITTKQIRPGTKLGIDLKTPYISGTSYFEGQVLDSHEKAKNLIYETRLKFTALDSQAEFLLAKLIEYFITGDNSSYE